MPNNTINIFGGGISVIIPAYNAESTINSCITSLLKQTYKNFEIIIVDDGSTDQTLQIVTQYKSQYNNIRIIHQNNQGVSAARNTAIEHVSNESEYICFVDADDTCEKDYLINFAKYFDSDKLLIQGFNLCNKESTRTILYNNSEILIKQMAAIGDLGHLWDKCFKKSIILKHNIRFNKGFTLGEDEAFVLDYIQYQSQLEYIDTAQYNYMAPQSKKCYANDNNMSMYFYCLERMAVICNNLGLPLHKVYNNMLNRCGRQFFKPSNVTYNTTDIMVKMFHVYCNNTKKVPITFTKFHFMIILLNSMIGYRGFSVLIKIYSKVFKCSK